jgi:hypothetical protein
MLKPLSKTMAAHRSGTLACFDFNGLSIGLLEGINKIKRYTKWLMALEMLNSIL